jgi:hypothetical protein
LTAVVARRLEHAVEERGDDTDALIEQSTRNYIEHPHGCADPQQGDHVKADEIVLADEPKKRRVSIEQQWWFTVDRRNVGLASIEQVWKPYDDSQQEQD